ncbi:Gfo/Idh/MocA family protein [Carnobacterium gallinarum]|uniref:Gfo/Idh/MocA family protein n=1 Tax=Carnobacterium gallinarum TaxID=2749 RepID=UPI000558DC23|nr:Gfo/Idh/MocA family oxidoreductase [Carnobacterium gallinarum]
MADIGLAVVGAGNIGTMHIDYLSRNQIKGCRLVAICDTDATKLEQIEANYPKRYQLYSSLTDLLKDSKVEALLIATPHYDHPTLAIEGMKAGKHVLIEKPAGVYTKKVMEMNQVAEETKLVFGIMYNQRTNPLYRKVRELIQTGELGEIRRTNWIITTWYRSQSYYNSGGWRATWAGEGGGVLLNQDPHQLDLWQWICGMPERIQAFAYFGKHRDIEVEDEVTAFVEYPNGATGVFITSVSETPGSNRLEIVGSKGKIVVEDQQLRFWQAKVDEAEFNRTYQGGFGEPEIWQIQVPIQQEERPEHQIITQNFINAILNDEELIAPGVEGINGLMISNAFHLSTWKDSWVELPLDEEDYYLRLQEKIQQSQRKKVVENVVLDTKATYS